jgi:excisionase family DNA binding protein
VPKSFEGLREAITDIPSGITDKPGLAEHLKVCQRTVDYLMARRAIPYMKIGRLVRFRIADVERALKRFSVEEIKLS